MGRIRPDKQIVTAIGQGYVLHTDASGELVFEQLSTLVDTLETVTSVSYDDATAIFTYIDENGTANTLTLPHVNGMTFDNATNILTITLNDGTSYSVDLSSLAGGGGGTFNSFNVTDGTNTETINDSDTLTFQGDVGIKPAVSPTDNVKYSLDLREYVFTNLTSGTDVTVPAAAGSIPSSAYVWVIRNGLVLPPTEYTIAGNTITFTVPFGTAPNSNGSETVHIKWFNP